MFSATAQHQLLAFGRSLEGSLASPADIQAFSQRTRSAYPELLAALPPRYAEVLFNLLDRLESSALFAEESCSFSQHDLVASLRHWADKAQERLG
jgi:hypothetical protein